jgi:AhpD family alkylhydroperoxidase
MTTNDYGTTDTVPQIPVRLDFDAHAAGFARAMAHLDRAATKELDAAGIDPLLRELVRVRASQLNGCACCIDMHTKDARAAGKPSSACTRTRCPHGGRLPSSPAGNGPRSLSPRTSP